MRRNIFLTVGIPLLFLFVSTAVFGGNWILDSTNGKLPADLEATILAAGGTLVKTMSEVGVAVAGFATREEAEAMDAHGFTVMKDVALYWTPSIQTAPFEHIGQDEWYYSYQWYLPSIGADLAWDMGYTGAGVRVAVVDTGIDYFHPDLAGKVDIPASASFVDYTILPTDDNGHGTHVAGIIGAADNGIGTIGVAPGTTLISVKVLDYNGTGYFSWIAAGIIHAANNDADIINLSLKGLVKKSGNMPYYNASDVAALINMTRKAVQYAQQKGALVVAGAGNDSQDHDHDWNYITIPAEAGCDVVVSATTPIGLQNFGTPASYSSYGQSLITVAAPGGDTQLYPAYGWWFDMMLSTYPGNSWVWMSGTSMACPVACGVAALILEKYGPMNPGKLKNKLANSADDLGQPGHDAFYGRGRVNAYKAVK